MPKLTLLSRISDGLPLAASMEDEKDHRELDGYKAQAKKLLKTMSNGAPARVSVESGGSVFQCARASDEPHPSPTARPPLPLMPPPLCRVSQLHQSGGRLLHVSDGEVVPQAVRVPGSCTAALAHLTHPAASAHLPRPVAVSCGDCDRSTGRALTCTPSLHPQHTHSTPTAHTLGAFPVCRLAFNYLEELLKEFNSKFRDEVESASRPYAFIKFGAPPALPLPLPLALLLPLTPNPNPNLLPCADTFIQRTKKLYVDTRTQRNLNKLNDVRAITPHLRHHPNPSPKHARRCAAPPPAARAPCSAAHTLTARAAATSPCAPARSATGPYTQALYTDSTRPTGYTGPTHPTGPTYRHRT